MIKEKAIMVKRGFVKASSVDAVELSDNGAIHARVRNSAYLVRHCDSLEDSERLAAELVAKLGWEVV